MRDYPFGKECVWIGEDEAGSFGAFITAGVGSIPNVLLEEGSGYSEDTEYLIEKLPITNVADSIRTSSVAESFVDLAIRGFFVYDWSDVHRTDAESLHGYERLLVPKRKITKAELSKVPELHNSVCIITDVLFEQKSLLKVECSLKCLSPT